jgi:MFS family permease
MSKTEIAALADAPMDAVAGDRLARRNALILAFAQALAGANNTVIVATTGIIGAVLAGDRAFATVPTSVMVVGMWLGTLPVGALARRYGRRNAYMAGALCGAMAGLLCAIAVVVASFALLCAGAFFAGLYAAAHQSYRFAAADTASEAFRPKAISWVLAGGVFAGLFGPQLVIVTKDLLPPYLFVASYLAQVVVALIAAATMLLLRIPRPVLLAGGGDGGRPIGEIFRQPRLVVAVICGVASYAMMNLMMTSAPVAMVDCNHSVTDATLGIQWHVMGMYAPSFITGSLIARFGVDRIVGVGLATIAVAALIGWSGITVAHFWSALVLLGIGWNFAFVGATAMVTQCHRPQERNRVQAVNDFLVFGTMAVGSFSSGQLLAKFGWTAVTEVVIPVVLVAGAMLVWLVLFAPKSALAPADRRLG